MTRFRSILWLTALLASAGAIAAVLAAIGLPLEAAPQSSNVTVVAKSPATLPSQQSTAVPPLASFEAAWRLPLRRPLVDAPPPPPVAVETVKPRTLPIRLIGTIVDGQRPRGVFMSGLASIELKGVGDKAGGAEVLAVDENSATLVYQGERFVLKREKDPFDPSGARYDAAVKSNPPAAMPKSEVQGGS